MATATTYEHITLDSTGVPTITGTKTKIVEIVMEVKAYGWSPEEIHFQHPYLSLGQIHSALAYYWDNRASIEMDISQRTAKVERIQRETSSHSIREKLQEKGLI